METSTPKPVSLLEIASLPGTYLYPDPGDFVLMVLFSGILIREITSTFTLMSRGCSNPRSTQRMPLTILTPPSAMAWEESVRSLSTTSISLLTRVRIWTGVKPMLVTAIGHYREEEELCGKATA